MTKTHKRRLQRLTPAEVAYIQLLHREGRSTRAISEVVKRPESTVRFWIKRENVDFTKKTARKPRSEPKNLRARRALATKFALMTTTKAGKTRPRYCSASSIAIALFKATGQAVSRWTVANDLRRAGLVNLVRKYVPTTAKNDQKNRLSACRGFLRLENLGKIIFSDEKIFTTNEYGCRTQWVRRGTRPLGVEKARWPVRVHVWAAIGKDYLVWVVLPNPLLRGSRTERNPNVIFKLDAAAYVRRILSPIVDHCTQTGSIFQQDGARVHTSNRSLNYLEKKGVQVLSPWPARSPDLNPIENLWSIVQRRVSDLRPTTYNELVQAIHDGFQSLEQSMINRLVASFPDRCKAVVKGGGAFL